MAKVVDVSGFWIVCAGADWWIGVPDWRGCEVGTVHADGMLLLREASQLMVAWQVSPQGVNTAQHMIPTLMLPSCDVVRVRASTLIAAADLSDADRALLQGWIAQSEQNRDHLRAQRAGVVRPQAPDLPPELQRMLRGGK